MSFILDALKKSELERQRQSTPGLIEVPVASRRRRVPVWVWVLAGLLCVNMTVLLLLVLRSPTPSTAPTGAGPGAGAGPGTAAPPQNAGAADHFSPLDNQPVYAPEIPVQDESAASTPATTASTPNVAAPGAPAAAAAARPNRRADPVLNAEPAENEEMLPTISELNLTGAQTLPDIHLDVHVYATRAADRFVYVNMRKYHEGQVLQEGPTLERIRRDGVVLNYNGLRFLVPRQ